MQEIIKDLKEACQLHYNAELITVSREDLHQLINYTERLENLKAVLDYITMDSQEHPDCSTCFVSRACIQRDQPDNDCIIRALSTCKSLSF